jgi:hypothetical protein
VKQEDSKTSEMQSLKSRKQTIQPALTASQEQLTSHYPGAPARMPSSFRHRGKHDQWDAR